MSIVSWINEDMVVLQTRTGADTMERIINGERLLENTDPVKDSLHFVPAFIKRNDNYLINRGILTKDEVEAFRKDNIIPDDVKENLNKK